MSVNSHSSRPDSPGRQTQTKRILITEDSPVTQDILKLVLSTKGHEVHIAHDGKAALKMLLEEPFDLALMDYHLPGLSGAEVVARFLDEHATDNQPVFIAMTADPDGFHADGNVRDAFVRVFAKPFDFDELLDFMETLGTGAAADGARLAGQDRGGRARVPGRTGAPKAGAPATGGPAHQNGDAEATEAHRVVSLRARPLGYADNSPLFWPQDIGPAGFSMDARRHMATGGDYDMVVVTEPATASDLGHLWTVGDLYLLPIIDETGHLGHKADVCLPKIPRGSAERIVQDVVREFAEARASVHLEIRQSSEPADKLLAGLYVRARKLLPEFTGASPLGFSYNIALEESEVTGLTGRLITDGLLEKSFVDRLHGCPACSSVRLNVREECFECRSPNLEETAIIHHFKCAYQGPLQDFKQGSDLVCPKCARELRHFGVDYDKPGTVVTCLDCGATSSDTAVGFKCLDCGAHTDGDVIATHDVFSHALTEKGRAFVEEGYIVTGAVQSQLKFADLPLDLVIALNKAARSYTEAARPFCLVAVGYPQRRLQLSEHGPRLVELSRKQLAENLRNYFGEAVIIHQGTDFDYLLIDRMSAENFQANVETYDEVAQSSLKIDLAPRFSVFGPSELFG